MFLVVMILLDLAVAVLAVVVVVFVFVGVLDFVVDLVAAGFADVVCCVLKFVCYDFFSLHSFLFNDRHKSPII